MIHETASGIDLDVVVIPRASVTTLGGIRDQALLVRLAAPPVEGAANEALVAFLARTFDVPKRAVRIVRGERSRRKRVAVDGLTVAAARAALRVQSDGAG